MLTLAVVVVAVLGAAGAAPAQGPVPAPPAEAQQPPVFAVGVDVVAVDASVVDADGRPVPGLGPEEFRVEVDGKPRRLVSVEYVGREIEPPSPPPARPALFSTNEDASRGRLVLLLVDRGNIGRGRGREVFEAASRFLDGLAPGDRVGLAFIPGPGSVIEFTADVEEVRRGLRGVVGTADRAGHRVPLGEAVAKIRMHNRKRWEEFLARECGGSLPERAFLTADPEAGVPFTVAQVARCQRELEQDAELVYFDYRERSRSSQAALRTTFDSLGRIEGPKTVVLISEGLGTESPGEVSDLGAAASRSQVTLFVLLLDTSSADASVVYSAIATTEDREVETGGLYDLAAQARGAVLRVMGSGDAAFRRVARELMGYYLLGFEPEPGDRDGKSHEVKVVVSRPKTTVRARGLLDIPSRPPSPPEQLAAALRSPLVDRGLPIRAATYALRDPATGKVRVLIAARVGRASRPVSVAFALSSATGEVAESRAYQGVAGGEGEWLEFTGEAVVDPNTYRLRLAAVDAAGRRGSVEHPVKAALVSAGGLEISDLVLAPGTAGGVVRPAVDLELVGEGLQALVEIGGRDRSRVEAGTVAVELAESADGPALLRLPAATGEVKDGARVARVGIVGGLLPPGTYTARAEVSLEGKPVAVVARPFRIVAPKPGASASGAPLAKMLVQTEPFDRRELLEPEALRHFVDRVAAQVPGPVSSGVAAAMEEARQGRPEAMLDRLADAGKEDARAAFLRGVSYYARGNLAAALTQLQAALARHSEIFPAAVYMGACYAAAGKDLDAIGAWQTALIGESGTSAALYALLGDALGRTGEHEQAAEILGEGAGMFPEDSGLRRRLGIALAKAGRREEALPLLTSWVDAHPDDNGTAFAMMALLFEGFARETAGSAPAGERERLARYARAYVEGKGPNREVIRCWLRYLEARSGG
jgi:VWFA-related protein